MKTRIPSVLLVGINGYGNRYVERLLPLLAEGSVHLAGIVDPSATRNRHLPELIAQGAPVLDTLDDFFALSIPADLACIATPIGLHAEHATTALAHGLHVLCEKPAAGCLADAQHMAQAAENAHRFLAIGYQLSFCRSTQALKADILSGRFGAPIRLRTRVLWPRSLAYFARNQWAGRIKDAAGHWVNDSPVNNATAHYLHNMLYLLGDRIDSAAEPLSIQAQLLRANAIETFDTCVMHLRVASGAELFFYTSHTIETTRDPEFEFIFEKGTVRCSGSGNHLSLTASFSDGSQHDYGNPCETYDQKLLDALAASIEPHPHTLACTIHTALPHLKCIEALRSLPVHVIPPEKTRSIPTPEGDHLLVVEGLYHHLMAAYDSWSLLPDCLTC